MSSAKKIVRSALLGEQVDEVVHVTRPSTAQLTEFRLAQQLEYMHATGEVFKEAMYEMSEIERRASYLAGVTSAIREHHAKLAETRGASEAEQATEQARFENYLRRLSQLAELGNRILITEAARASDAVSQSTVGDTLGV